MVIPALQVCGGGVGASMKTLRNRLLRMMGKKSEDSGIVIPLFRRLPVAWRNAKAQLPRTLDVVDEGETRVTLSSTLFRERPSLW